MPVWAGATWLCDHCDFENAEIRKRCRHCGALDPGPMHEEPEIEAGLLAERRENVEFNHSIGFGSEHEHGLNCHVHGSARD